MRERPHRDSNFSPVPSGGVASLGDAVDTAVQACTGIDRGRGAGGEQDEGLTYGYCTKRTSGLIYFVQENTHGSAPIKIGWALRDVAQRVGELQIGNPNELRLLGTMPGTLALEKRLQWFFEADRIRGEWFRYSVDLWELATGRARLEEFQLGEEWPQDPATDTRARPAA